MQSSLGIDLKSIGEANKHALHEAIEVSSHAVFQRFGRPQWLWKVERLLNIEHEAKLKSSVEVLYTCIHEIVRQSVDRMAQKKQSGEDIANETCKSIVELFLESPQSGEDGLTLDDFVPFILTLAFASRETTVDSLIWLFYSVITHPDVEKKLRAEMDRELSHLPSDKSTYLTMETLEVVRLLGGGDQGDSAAVPSGWYLLP